MNENFELENMRQQMETLKSKLDKQEIVNERMIRYSMKKRMDKITRTYYKLIIVGLLVIPLGYWSFVVASHLSVAFWIGTCIFMILCNSVTYYNCRNLNYTNLMTNNMLEVRRRMAKGKKFDANWLLVGMPLLMAWVGWLMFEIYKINNKLLSYPLFWSACTGIVVGLIIGFTIHFRTQRQYQEIIDEIEEITAA
ncbi:MAG: hypothetical protein IKR18_03145 [Bacteroidaceae bacterium]|nr:hypothetical protein [Bacteroidaceae bacterium]